MISSQPITHLILFPSLTVIALCGDDITGSTDAAGFMAWKDREGIALQVVSADTSGTLTSAGTAG